MEIIPNEYLIKLFYGSNEVIYVTCIAQLVACNNHSINGIYVIEPLKIPDSPSHINSLVMVPQKSPLLLSL